MKSFVIHVDNNMKCWQFKENTGVRTESSCEECKLTEFLVRENETYQDGTNGTTVDISTGTNKGRVAIFNATILKVCGE